jgi:hypothetical protein
MLSESASGAPEAGDIRQDQDWDCAWDAEVFSALGLHWQLRATSARDQRQKHAEEGVTAFSGEE